MRAFLRATLAAALMAVSAPAYVHHSGAMFEDQKEIEVTGTVSEFNWTNPHASFKVDVLDAQGKTHVWAIEMNSPNNLVRDGWKRSTIKPGDKVSVRVRPLRDGKPGGLYLGITLADGTKLGGSASNDYPKQGAAK